ncbi:MAG: hypothetical protein ACREBI_07045 [Nitrosotalea sp.]
MNKKLIAVAISAAIVVIGSVYFLLLTPSKEYALSVNPIISTGQFGTYTHVTIKNIGRQSVTNVRVDYGINTKPDLIPAINPGERIILSPPSGSDLLQVRVTADRGIDIVVPYNRPTSGPLVGIGGLG